MLPYASKKTFKIISLLVFVIGVGRTVLAQDVPLDIISRIKNLQRLRPDHEPAPSAANGIQQIEKDLAVTNASLDQHAQETLKTLKNPFESKLPKAKKKGASKDSQPQPGTGMKKPSPGTSDGKDEPVVEPDRSRYIISGLVWDTDLPQAILNDKVVRIGETIDGWTITDITQEGIEFSMQENSYLIKPKGASYVPPHDKNQ